MRALPKAMRRSCIPCLIGLLLVGPALAQKSDKSEIRLFMQENLVSVAPDSQTEAIESVKRIIKRAWADSSANPDYKIGSGHDEHSPWIGQEKMKDLWEQIRSKGHMAIKFDPPLSYERSAKKFFVSEFIVDLDESYFVGRILSRHEGHYTQYFKPDGHSLLNIMCIRETLPYLHEGQKDNCERYLKRKQIRPPAH